MNSPETIDTSVEQTRSIETLSVYNTIQRVLIERYINIRASDGVDKTTASLEWVDNNSSAFRKLVKLMPDLLERYKQDSEVVLSEIEKALQ